MPRVAAFNIEYGAQGYPLGRAVNVVRESRADAVAIAEAQTDAGVDSAARIAAALGWHHVALPANTSAVISRWPLRVVDAGSGAVLVTPPTGVSPPFVLISAHFDDFPYQPFQAGGIPYCYDYCQRGLSSGTALARAADEARGRQVALVAAAARRYARRGPVVVAGDFNEPSHLDWTPRAAAAGLCPVAVAFPASRQLHAAGLVDAFRRVHPDPVAAPGHTWPAHDPGYPHRPDRIDFVYVRAGDRVAACEVVPADEGGPSDHRLVVADVWFARARPHLDLGLGPNLAFTIALAAVIVLAILAVVVIMFGRRHSDKNADNSIRVPDNACWTR